MVLTVNSDTFPKQHQLDALGSGDNVFPVHYDLNFFVSFVEEL
jgi:hypothetical protein